MRWWLALLALPLAVAAPVQASCHEWVSCGAVDAATMDQLAPTRGTTRCGWDFLAMAHTGVADPASGVPVVAPGAFAVIQVSLLRPSDTSCTFVGLAGDEQDPVVAAWHPDPGAKATAGPRDEVLLGLDVSLLAAPRVHPVAFEVVLRDGSGQEERVRTWVDVEVSPLVLADPPTGSTGGLSRPAAFATGTFVGLAVGAALAVSVGRLRRGKGPVS